MIEALKRGVSAGEARVCLFDFDGTVSLIRSGWMDVMVPMMVEILMDLKTGEAESELRATVEEFIWRLTGKQTVYQMIALAEEVEKRGGTPLAPVEYKKIYLTRLGERIRGRLEELGSGHVSPDKYLVPGTRAWIEALRERGMQLYLASGTDQPYVQAEADLLDVSRYFDGRIYGALDDYKSFSKKILIERLIAQSEFAGHEFLGFGDGYVEIENVKEVGGVAVGVATNEPDCLTVDEWKRRRLAGVGADFIIPNFLDTRRVDGGSFFPMESKYPIFDRSRLLVKPLAERENDLEISRWLAVDEIAMPFEDARLAEIARRMAAARARGAARILMMGAHVLRAGVNAQIIDLVERGFVDHIAMNGAGVIHDYELARIGATTESVARYIRTGEFGLWRETGELNDWIREAAAEGLGLGENAGRRIAESDYPHKRVSVLAACWRRSVPVTAHVGIGYDILHEHPGCDGAAVGAASYRDFLIFARTMEQLEGGVLLSFGSAIMAPEVYLKALSMVRNVAQQEGRTIRDFATAVFDLVPIEGDYRRELPKTDAGYYFRPHKTLLVRTVADGGASFYVRGDHRATLPALRRAVLGAA